MLVAVPARVGRDVAQPEVRRQIDHLGLRRIGQQFASAPSGWCACGSAQNTRSSACAFQSMPSIETSVGRSNGANCGNTLAHLLPGLAVGGEQREFGTRMAQQQAHQLRAGIARGAQNADLRFRRHVSLRKAAVSPPVLKSPDQPWKARICKESHGSRARGRLGIRRTNPARPRRRHGAGAEVRVRSS